LAKSWHDVLALKRQKTSPKNQQHLKTTSEKTTVMKENNRQLRRHMRNQSQNWPESNANRFNNDRDFATRNGHRLNDGYNDDYRTHDNWEEEQDYYGNQYNNSTAFGQGSSSYGPDQYNEQGYENRGYGRPNRQSDEDMNYGSMNQNRRNDWEDRSSNGMRDQYNRGNQWANQWGNSYQDHNDQGRMGTTPGYDRHNQWQNDRQSSQWGNNDHQQQWGNNRQDQWNNNNDRQSSQWGNNDRQQQWNDQGNSNQYRDQQYSQFQNKNSIGNAYATDRFSNRNSWENNTNNNNNQYGNDRSWNNSGNNSNSSDRWGAMGGNDRSSSWMNNDQNRSSMNEGNHRGKGPRGYQRSEDRIKEDIHDRLSDDSFLDASEIEVSMENNNVVLSGSVESRTAKRRAEDIAESVSGVSNVENRLRVAEHQQQSGSKTDSSDKKQSDATGKMNATGTATSGTTANSSTDTTDKSKSKTTA
jgi:osmotically-inducible protein OsmY